MEPKAFDLAVLLEKLKGRGLDLAEDAAKIVVEEVFVWSEDSVKLSGNKFDDMVLPFIPTLKAAALGVVDKIDGTVGA